MSVRAGRTRITAQESLGNLIGGIFGGIGGGVGGGGTGMIAPLGAALGGGLGVALIIPVWLAGVYLTARVIYRRSVRSHSRELEDLMDRLAALARELVPGPPALPAPDQRLLR